MDISHEDQQQIWDKEHQKPRVLQQMDSAEASSGVMKFYEFLVNNQIRSGKGVELGCGKGRNSIWLAQQGYEMWGFDFSPVAIEEAKHRSTTVSDRAHFLVQDATEAWNFDDASFDFGIDCFATTDIESEEGRKKAVKEMYRVLRPGAYLLAYLLSPEDGFHKEMLEKRPASERNAFHHETGKFEKVFDDQDIQKTFEDSGFTIIKHERIAKTPVFYGKSYPSSHHWLVLQK
ncbi:MAG: class I SAM-dependent methyltransferase [Patescibacteria group bacterium]